MVLQRVSKDAFYEPLMTPPRDGFPTTDSGASESERGTQLATLERRGGLAVWRQIAQDLQAELESGRIAPGARLPTEAELARRYEVNRHTVRRAVADLEERGLVRVQQGRGTFACAEMIDYPVTLRTRFSENIRRNKQAPGGRLLSAETVSADRWLSERLEVAPGTKVLRLDSLRTADGVPISLGSHYFPADRFEGFEKAVARHGAITPALAEYGVSDYTRLETRLSARLAGRRDGKLLMIAETAPVLVTDSVNVDPDGRPIQAGEARYPAERVQLVVES